MKKYLMISLVFLLSGCAYFNIFYNAEHYYNQAVKPLESGSQVRVDLLEKSIEKSSKILEFHAESKYVDDALILIGKSYMYLADYTKAIRKFNELITYYAESPYHDEAVYYLGNTYRLQGEKEIAIGYFQRLYSSEGEFRLKAYIATVDILTEKEIPLIDEITCGFCSPEGSELIVFSLPHDNTYLPTINILREDLRL